MAISVRARFIAISVSITLIGLFLFTNVIYDKAIGYKHFLEKNAFRVLEDQLLTPHDEHFSLTEFKHMLSANINNENQPALLFAIIHNNQQVGNAYLKSTEYINVFSDLSELITSGKNEGQLKVKDKTYYWLIRHFPEFNSNQHSLMTIYPLSTSAKSETLKFFGTPLFIAGILLLWIMVWASIILSSLVTKLQNQKQVLSSQSADIAKARDDAEQANQAKSSFLANMSHEIRTPLTSIIGFAECCLDSSQSMQQRFEAISTIISNGNHLLHIINDVLDISKIEAGKLDIENKPISLTDLIQEVNMLIKVLAFEKNLPFSVNSTFPLPKEISIDQLRLKQILLNLCSNAIKFTEQGNVTLNISYQEKTGNLSFEIVDTGIGMTKEQLDKILDPFQQADASITRKYGGTGLGLTLSKKLTKMLGGSLTMESKLNIGSRFTVEFKLGDMSESNYIYDANYDALNTSKVMTAQDIPNVSGKILVAEDNKDIQALIKLLIQKVGAELTIVGNGQQAIDKALESEFDLIFLDIQMPVMSGIDALQQLRAKNYNKPIIAMTANVMQKDRDECFAAGFDGFVSKPINKVELYSAITDHLKDSEIVIEEDCFITSSLLIEEPQIIELVDAFLVRIPEILDMINDALLNEDWDEFSDQIHQMKGLGGAFGYSILTEISQKIEFVLTTHDYKQVNDLTENLNKLCAQAIAGKNENYKIIDYKA